MKQEINIGDIVLSNAGRDAGKYLVVVAKEDNFAFLCNGKLRGCGKPKKKKLKHIKPFGKVSDFALDKLLKGESLSDKELKAELRVFSENLA